LTLQKKTMSQQDESLDVLADIIKRQKEIGMTIGNELDLQNQLLGEVNDDVTRVGDRMAIAGKKLDRVARK
jgi:regulator of vacuolar morphogenesis